MDKTFIEQMKKKLDHELRAKETEVVLFWKEELEKLIRKNTESLAALQVDLKGLLARMENRLKAVKRSLD